MITVVMTTYSPRDKPERGKYAIRTTNSMLAFLGCDLEPSDLRLHIADDGSYDSNFMLDVSKAVNTIWGSSPNITNSARHGIGASLNLALQNVEGLWVYNTDDWVLSSTLDLDPAIKLIQSGYDVVRLGPIHPNLSCVTRFSTDLGWWLDIDPHYGFAFATRPFLATKKFYNKIGPFKEDVNAYIVERDYADRVAQHNDIKIALAGNVLLEGPWVHIGEVEVGTDDPN